MLIVYTIYWSPTDYPGRFVVRPHACGNGKSYPLTACTLHDSLEDARGSLPPGLYRMDREPGGEPQIVESWL